jgi:hypothetical protein
MDSHRRHLLLLLVLISLAGIAVGFRSFFMANIIEPIAVLFWAFWRIIASVNQSIYWSILILICLILVLRLIPIENDNLPNPVYNYRYKPSSRVKYWQTLIDESILGKEEGKRLRVNLENLFKSANAESGRTDSKDSDEANANGQRQLSLRAKRFLFPQKRTDGAFDIKSLIPKRFQRWSGKFVPQDTTAITEILEYMETEMEMSHVGQSLDRDHN